MGPPPPPETWTAAEVEAGRAECGKRLSGLHVLSEALGPIKEGMCGTPAPLRLKGFEYGAEPALAFEPAPVVSCKLAEALHRWAVDAVQPEAKTHLQTRIVGMTTVSSYNCRSRYGDQNQRLSEHAFVNALDISEFVSRRKASVSPFWTSGTPAMSAPPFCTQSMLTPAGFSAPRLGRRRTRPIRTTSISI